MGVSMASSTTVRNDSPTETDMQSVASRLERLAANDVQELTRHVLLLVNVVSKAKELKDKGLEKEEILNGALEEGKRVGFVEQISRFSELRSKAANTVFLLTNDRELAVAACEAFIEYRASMAENEDRKKSISKSYREALQRMLDEIGTASTNVQPRTQDSISNMLYESTRDNPALLSNVLLLVGILYYYDVRGNAMLRSNPNHHPDAVVWRVVHEFAEGYGAEYAMLGPQTVEVARKIMKEQPRTAESIFSNLDKETYKEARALLEKAFGIEKAAA